MELTTDNSKNVQPIVDGVEVDGYGDEEKAEP